MKHLMFKGTGRKLFVPPLYQHTHLICLEFYEIDDTVITDDLPTTSEEHNVIANTVYMLISNPTVFYMKTKTGYQTARIISLHPWGFPPKAKAVLSVVKTADNKFSKEIEVMRLLKPAARPA